MAVELEGLALAVCPGVEEGDDVAPFQVRKLDRERQVAVPAQRVAEIDGLSRLGVHPLRRHRVVVPGSREYVQQNVLARIHPDPRLLNVVVEGLPDPYFRKQDSDVRCQRPAWFDQEPWLAHRIAL